MAREVENLRPAEVVVAKRSGVPGGDITSADRGQR